MISVNNLVPVDDSREISQSNRNKCHLKCCCIKRISLLHTSKSVVQSAVLKKFNFKKMPFWLKAPTPLNTFRNELTHTLNTPIYLFYKLWPDIMNLLEATEEIRAQKLNTHSTNSKLYSSFLIKTVLSVFKAHCGLTEHEIKFCHPQRVLLPWASD